ncbi:ankyrin [Piromyces finnis]|uniref:Ankyrin n=1 Tax=Piromyces finnis TaxID=1754191 RepID=A0A1Y1UXI3_9FUNG|nr:ankyrin [Piromyces finnis]|eukprot:ORX42837.1 ankyrin [Piromyces finnis]
MDMIIGNKFINIGYIDTTETGYRRTPLIYAVQRKNFELTKFLIHYNTVNVNLILQFILNIKYGKQMSDEECQNLSKNCILESDINHQDDNGNTALLYACKLNNKKIIELLLKNGANTNLVNVKNKSPLMYSCKNGNKSCVDILLQYHAKLDIESNSSGKTAFKYACGSGKLPVIKTLIQHKAINNKRHYSDAFNYAPQNEFFDDVYHLLQSYTEICLNDYNYTLSEENCKDPLIIVSYKNSMELISHCIKGNIEKVRSILAMTNEGECMNSLDIDFRDKHGYTALMWASYFGHTNIVKELIYHHANINLKSDIEESAILLACKKGHVDTAKVLIKYGADVNDTNYHDDTLLMIACLRGNFKLTQLLLENNANVNAQNKSNDSALIYAVEKDQEECVDLLLQHNADLTFKNDYNDSIFVIAYRKNNIKIMDLLLTDYEYKYNNGSNGEDDRLMIDERNLISSGKTLLMLACSQGNKDMIKILIKHRIDALFKNYNGNTALHISCQHRNTEVAEMLLQYQPEIVNIQNKNGKTPLMIACKLGDTLMVSLLLKYNGSINLKDHNGKTALMIACKYGHIDTINYIVDYFDQINKKENPIKRDQSSNVFLINRISKSKMYQIKHKIKIHQRIKSSLKTSKLLNYNMNPKNFMDSSCSYLLNKFKKNNSKSSKTCFNRMNILTHTLATFIKANNKNNKKYPISKGIIQNSNLTPHLNDNYHHGHHNMSNDTNTGFPKPITITNNEIIDINSKDTKYGYSALLWACKYNGNNTIKIIEKLLAIGANINDVSNMNQNALILSIITPSQITNTNQPINLDLISFLLHHGIDINVSSSSDKYTALMLACQKRYQLVVKMLLNAHAERSLLNNEGKTAMDIALINNYFEIVQLF